VVVQWAQPRRSRGGFVGCRSRDGTQHSPDTFRKSFFDGRWPHHHPDADEGRGPVTLATTGQVYVRRRRGIETTVNPQNRSVHRSQFAVGRNVTSPPPPRPAPAPAPARRHSKILGIVWSPCQEVFKASRRALHSDNPIGGPEPAKKKTIRGKESTSSDALTNCWSRFPKRLPGGMKQADVGRITSLRPRSGNPR